MINRNEKNFLKEITLRKKVSKFINKNEKHIQKKFNNYLWRYTKDKALLLNTRTTSRSSLQYFHKELNIDEKVMNLRKNLIIDRINKQGITIDIKKMSNYINEPFGNLLQINEYRNKIDFKSYINRYSDYNNPELIIKKENGKKEYYLYNEIIKNPNLFIEKNSKQASPNLNNKRKKSKFNDLDL